MSSAEQKLSSDSFSVSNLSQLTEEVDSLDGSYETSRFLRKMPSQSRSYPASFSNNQRHTRLPFSTIGLYGRDSHKETLQARFRDQALSVEGGSPCLVTLAGPAGAGKSALASQMEPFCADYGGFFVSGKFDAHRVGETDQDPYAAIRVACNQLAEKILRCDQDLLSERCDTDSQPLSRTSSTVVQPSTHSSKSISQQEEQIAARNFSFTDIQSKLQQELGDEDLTLLLRVVPVLAEVLGLNRSTIVALDRPWDQGTVEATDVQAQKHRLYSSFRHFFRTVGSFGTVLLVLDDVQWADAASLELIEFLVATEGPTREMRQSTRLMLIVSYRDNEVDEDHRFAQMMDRLKKRDLDDVNKNGKAVSHIEEISVDNLSVAEVTEFLADLMWIEEHRVRPLAELVHGKTLGNAFYLIQFLTSLVDEDILQAAPGSRSWSWDMERAAMHIDATANVVDLMRVKLNKMPRDTRSILKLLSCLGSTFALSIVRIIMDHRFRNQIHLILGESAPREAPSTGRKALECLEHCVMEGWIVRLRRNLYLWVHDKIQEAVLSLIEPAYLPTLQRRIGELLLDKLSDSELEGNAFVVANLLNAGIQGMALSAARRIQTAKTNLAAAKRAIASASLSSAVRYLERGIMVVPEDHWSTHYKFSLDLFSTAAEAEYCIGNFNRVQRYSGQILAQTQRPLLDHRRAYNALMDAIGSQDQHLEAANLCLEVLEKLGCPFPKRGVGLKIAFGFLKAKVSVKTISSELVSKMPVMKKDLELWVMSLLDKLFTFLYLAGSEMLPLSVLKSLQWTRKKGVSEFSPSAFARLGMSFTAFLGDPQTGKEFAEHALSLLNKVKSGKAESRTLMLVHSFVMPWSCPLKKTLEPLFRAYETGMATGFSENPMWCIYFMKEHSIHLGIPISKVLADFPSHISRMDKFQQLRQRDCCKIVGQALLNLSGQGKTPYVLTGELMNQDLMWNAAMDANDVVAIASLQRWRLYVAFYFEEYQIMMQLLEDTNLGSTIEKAQPGLYGLCPMIFHNGLACISMMRETGNNKYTVWARRFANTIKKWVDKGNPNVKHYDALLNAELAALFGKHSLAMRFFGSAILFSGSGGFKNDQALVYERFGEYNLKQGNVNEAKYGLEQAIQLYEAWGAHGKVNLIKQKHILLLAPPVEINVSIDE